MGQPGGLVRHRQPCQALLRGGGRRGAAGASVASRGSAVSLCAARGPVFQGRRARKLRASGGAGSGVLPAPGVGGMGPRGPDQLDRSVAWAGVPGPCLQQALDSSPLGTARARCAFSVRGGDAAGPSRRTPGSLFKASGGLFPSRVLTVHTPGHRVGSPGALTEGQPGGGQS